jgi:hypothetical protein
MNGQPPPVVPILPTIEPTRSKNPAEPKKKLLHVAQLMDLDPEGDFTIFRRFGELNIRNLLYMQEDLTRLERKICTPPQVSDKKSPTPSTFEGVDFDTLGAASGTEEQCSDTSSPAAKRDRVLMLGLRTLLSEYSKAVRNRASLYFSELSMSSDAAVLAYSQILQVSSPNVQTVVTFQRAKKDATHNDGINMTDHSSDLIRLIPRPGEHTWLARQLDRFTFIQCLFNNRQPKLASHPEYEYLFYNGSYVGKLERFIICLVFCMMLLLPTVLLTAVTYRPWQLAITASFTLAGCFGSAALTRARNWEVLSITAA